MKIHPSRLEAKVAAVNGANKLANEFVPIILEACKAFVGQKVLKADNSLTAKFKAAMPELPSYLDEPKNERNIYFETSNYGIYAVIAFNANHEKGSYRHSFQVICAGITNAVLSQVYSLSPLRADFTPQEVTTLRKNFEEARAAFGKAEAEVSPFKMWDA